MSDFDIVLERLVADPAFAAALSAHPAAALAGYRLSPDEMELLHSQISQDAGGQSTVETRANQSSVFGLLTPLAGLGGAVEAFGQGSARQTFGSAPGLAQGAGLQQGFGASEAPLEEFGNRGQRGPVEEFSHRAPVEEFTRPGSVDRFSHEEPYTQFGAQREPVERFSYRDPVERFSPPPQPEGFGHAPGQHAVTAEPPVPDGYRTRVDSDGDGDWDRHRLRGTSGGGVDIHVDANSDGRVDFIGHDTDADGLVDFADYDRDRDGFFERRSYDDNGDGWLDRHESMRPRPSA